MPKNMLAIVLLAALVIAFVLLRSIGFAPDNLVKEGSVITGEGGEPSPYSSWIKFTPKEQSFSISFPREPEHVHEEAYDDFGTYIKVYDIYAAFGLDSIAYMAEVIAFPKEKNPEENPNIFRETIRDITSQNKSNKLVDSKEIQFQGRKAMLFTLESGDKIIDGTIFARGGTLYILSKIAPKSIDKEAEDYDYFVESLSFDNNKQKEKP